MGLHVVILAAGQGSRMNSALPKVLHLLAGQALLSRVVASALALSPAAIHVIYGHGGDEVRAALADLPVNWIEQTEQLGTGHALLQAMPYIDPDDQVLVLYGDVPLITPLTLQELLDTTPKEGVGIIGATYDDPSGLGRLIRDNSGNILQIVEHRDADAKQLQIKEVYSGILTAKAALLAEWLPQLSHDNAQGEYYLTEVIDLAVQAKYPVIAVLAKQSREVEGVNDRQQLADLERYHQLQVAKAVMLSGASLMDPARFDVRGQLTVDKDVIFDVNVVIEGDVHIGKNCHIGPNVVIKNSTIGDNVTILANSVLDGATVAADCQIGPFARLRPGSQLQSQARVGNFVEIKNAAIGVGSKVNHLSYIGDATIGATVNIGAGTITCNYDGVNKHQTVIEDGAFVGSGTQLIAPVTVGSGAYIGSGSTISRNAPPKQLTVARARQVSLESWRRPQKAQLDEEG